MIIMITFIVLCFKTNTWSIGYYFYILYFLYYFLIVSKLSFRVFENRLFYYLLIYIKLEGGFRNFLRLFSVEI